jgi:hypothetical protein
VGDASSIMPPPMEPWSATFAALSPGTMMSVPTPDLDSIFWDPTIKAMPDQIAYNYPATNRPLANPAPMAILPTEHLGMPPDNPRHYQGNDQLDDKSLQPDSPPGTRGGSQRCQGRVAEGMFHPTDMAYLPHQHVISAPPGVPVMGYAPNQGPWPSIEKKGLPPTVPALPQTCEYISSGPPCTYSTHP